MISTDQNSIPAASSIEQYSSPRDRPLAVRSWTGAASPYPRESTVADLFERAAKANPENLAVVSAGIRLTYEELNLRANRLAHRLRRAGVGTESLVGVGLERSPQFIIALLAILKAGGAYVPFDRNYPRERLDFMFDDTQTTVLITEQSQACVLQASGNITVIVIDDESDSALAGDDDTPARTTTANSLAYVMYTSGSTGRPKGVMVENRAIVRLVSSTNYCEFGPHGVFLQAAPVSFDASTFEIWGALLNGGTVAVAPATASLEDIGRIIREEGVNTLWLTSSLFNLFVDERLDDLAPVQQILAGGEALSARHVRRALEALPGTTIINGYGPTENTTFTCCHTMRPGDAVPDSVPIGRPIANTFVYILDEARNPVSPGEMGELYAGGDGVARGYLHASALTAEKFMRDPFSTELAARMYRTGDMVRWREDGVIEFVGRLDNQVKILGHRIELGEIETTLGLHPEVMQTCVLIHSDDAGNKHLVAYFTAEPGAVLTPEKLKDFLAVKLPSYMVPGIYVQVSTFPLTPNGKLDRAALPVPDLHPTVSTGEVAHSEVEEEISAVWQKLLGAARVGIDDNFFDIGGTSLMLLAVHSQLQKALVTNISVVDLFEFTTIRQLAERIAKSDKKDVPAFASAQSQGQKQRDAFARRRAMKGLTQ
jgi:amino acid adenylation domain-containing protein